LEEIETHEKDLVSIACVFDVVLVKHRLGSARCEYLGLSEKVAPPCVLEQLSYHMMHLVLYVEGSSRLLSILARK